MSYISLRSLLGLAACGALSIGILFAQGKPGGGGGAPGGGSPGGGSTGGNTGGGGIPGGGPVGTTPGRNNTSPFPGQTQPGQQFPGMNRPIFLQGRVMLDDGNPPPEPVLIERVCSANPKPEGYTDTKGRFSFELGRNNAMYADASTSGPTDIMSNSSASSPGGGRPVTERELMSCELRASLVGYRSDVINLSGRRVLDSPDVGTIILHRMGNVEGYTVSATSAMAPKDAKKAYEKALDQIKKNKWTDARTNLEKAVEVYPKYAAAWHDLGRAYEVDNKPDEARKAYSEALNADSKFLKPYMFLAGISMREQKWQDVADFTSRLIKLDPYDYPGAFYYNAIANLNMRKLDEAEKSAREAVKIDSAHAIPKANHVLGVILANKQDFAGAAESMKAYLALVPDGRDNEFVRKQLADVEKSLAASSGAARPVGQRE